MSLVVPFFPFLRQQSARSTAVLFLGRGAVCGRVYLWSFVRTSREHNGKMKHEYHEGVKAGENFKRLATVVLQKPKTTVVAPKKHAKPAGKKRG